MTKRVLTILVKVVKIASLNKYVVALPLPLQTLNTLSIHNLTSH
jgi:hypothetical protein